MVLGLGEIMLQLSSLNSLSAKDIVEVQTAKPREIFVCVYIFYYDKGARPRTCVAG